MSQCAKKYRVSGKIHGLVVPNSLDSLLSDLIQGKSIEFSAPQARKFWDLGTLFSEIVDFFVEIVDFFTEIVDTHLFVERVPGGLDNRRHVSTIH